MAYKYTQRLGQDDLRLLEPIGISSDRLSFRVITVPREQAGSYTAVSYTWGSDDATKTIFLDGKPFSVRPNLWACLFHLATHDADSKPRRLWVDAICINQTDNDEKNNQVWHMDRTYLDAHHVAAWLGLLPLGPGGRELSALNRQNATLQVDDFDWHDHIECLARRPYWKRFWVIQEFLLASDIVVHCGNMAIHWQDFQTILCDAADINMHRSSPEDWVAHHLDAVPLIMSRHPDRHPSEHEPLRALLERHGRSQCFDPRDRVFALLGLVPDEERRLLSRIFPDYRMTDEEVTIIALAHMLQVPCVDFDDEVNVESDNLFKALQIKSRAKRAELLRRAEELDYLGTESADDAKRQIRLSNPGHGLSQRPPPYESIPGPSHSSPSWSDAERLIDAIDALTALHDEADGHHSHEAYGTFSGGERSHAVYYDEFGIAHRLERTTGLVVSFVVFLVIVCFICLYDGCGAGEYCGYSLT